MLVSIDQKNLKVALVMLKSATTESRHKAFLGGVNIVAANGLVAMTTYDLETSIVLEMVADIADPGTAFLPLKTLQAIVNACKNQVEIRIVADGIYRVCNAEIRDIASPAPVPYHASEYNKVFSIPALGLARALKKGGWAMLEDASRYMLQTTFIESDGLNAVAISCNTHVLGMVKLESTEPHVPFSLNIPKTMADIIAKYFAKENALLHISQDNERVTARGMLGAAQVTISSRRVQGKFPDWKRIVPSQSFYRVELDRGDLLDTLKSLKTVARSKVAFGKFDFSDGKNLSIVHYDDAQKEYRYGCDIFDGSFPYKIGFNIACLYNVIAGLSESKVSFLLGADKELPVIVKDSEDLFVIMPVRV